MKINEFFTFLFDEEVLRERLRPGWIKLYDFKYIDNEIIEGLLKLKIKLNEIIDFILKKAKVGNITINDNSTITGTHSGKEKSNLTEFEKKESEFNLPDINKKRESNPKKISVKKRAQSARKITVPKPFNLSENKPRIFQDPIEMNCHFIQKPVPIGNYKKTSLKEIEEKRKNRLEKIKQNTLNKYNILKPFNFESDKRPSNKEKIKEEVEKQIESTLQFNKKFYNPPKDYSKIPADIKYNETAIIKEEYLIEKKRKEEEEALNKILIEKKDTKDYERWVAEMKLKDDLIRMEEVQKRKIELDLNKEVAQNYFTRRTRINQIKALEHKQQEIINAKNREEKKKKEIEEKRETAKEIKKECENILKTKNELLENNKEVYKNRKEEFNILLVLAKEQKKVEEEKRNEIIRQIRELEKIPLKRTSGFDPTETPGYGLLEEMSLVELKERLELQKKMHNQLINAKREENKLLMIEKNENLMEKANKIALNRDKMRNKKEVEKKMKIEALKEKEELIKKMREKNLMEVKEKIENKKDEFRKEDEKFQKKIREIQLQRQFLQQGSSIVEEKKFKMFEDGLERKINDRQNQLLIDQEQKEVVQWKNLKQRYQSARIDIRKQKEKLLNYKQEFDDVKHLNDLYLNEERIFVKAIHDKEKAIRNFQKEEIIQRNKFSNTINKKNQKRVQSAKNRISKTKSNINVPLIDDKKLNETVSEKKLDVINENSDNEDNPIMNKLEKEKVKEEKVKEAIPA